MKENYNEIFKDNNDNSNLNNISIKKTQTFNNNTDYNEIIQKNYNDNANDFLNGYLEDNYEDNDNNYFEDENNLEILKNIEMPSPEVKIKDNKYSIEFVSNNYEYLNEKKNSFDETEEKNIKLNELIKKANNEFGENNVNEIFDI